MVLCGDPLPGEAHPNITLISHKITMQNIKTSITFAVDPLGAVGVGQGIHRSHCLSILWNGFSIRLGFGEVHGWVSGLWLLGPKALAFL